MVGVGVLWAHRFKASPSAGHRRRKLHCTRNFIHMNLFVSFMLRAISVFIKDWILYAEQDSNHCFISTVSELGLARRAPPPWNTPPSGFSRRLSRCLQPTWESRIDLEVTGSQ